MTMQTAFKYPDDENACGIRFPALIPAKLIQRDNRFRISVLLPTGQEEHAHLANPGRLQELLIPGSPIWLSEAKTPSRKTAFDTQLIENDGHLISLNSQLPNDLVSKALTCGLFTELKAYTGIKREVPLGNSRIDFKLSNGSQHCWLEVKSVTLVENGFAAFPDAPTLRGRKHLYELIDAVHHGDAAAVVFVVQRSDAKGFTPHDATDPEFGKALRLAHQAGVRIYAVGCCVSLHGIHITHQLPVYLDAPPA